MGREVKEPEVQIPQIDRPRVGTDYAKILVEEEERRLLEVSILTCFFHSLN